MSDLTVLIVDDDKDFAESLSLALSRLGVTSRCLGTAADALFALRNSRYDCLVCDFRLQDRDGIALLEEARHIDPAMPAIVITAFGNVDLAMRAVNAGAFSFLEKPFAPRRLFELVLSAIGAAGELRTLRARMDEAKALLASLSQREREVVRDLVEGRTSRQIAAATGTSPRTVEAHRSNILAKLNLQNTSALIRLAVYAEIPDEVVKR